MLIARYHEITTLSSIAHEAVVHPLRMGCNEADAVTSARRKGKNADLYKNLLLERVSIRISSNIRITS